MIKSTKCIKTYKTRIKYLQIFLIIICFHLRISGKKIYLRPESESQTDEVICGV